MEFKIDFSQISWIEVSKIDVSIDEVYSIFNNSSSGIMTLKSFEIIVGFSNKRKFIVVAFEIAKNINFDIEVIQIDLPYEEDIKQIWCAH